MSEVLHLRNKKIHRALFSVRIYIKVTNAQIQHADRLSTGDQRFRLKINPRHMRKIHSPRNAHPANRLIHPFHHMLSTKMPRLALAFF